MRMGEWRAASSQIDRTVAIIFIDPNRTPLNAEIAYQCKGFLSFWTVCRMLASAYRRPAKR